MICYEIDNIEIDVLSEKERKKIEHYTSSFEKLRTNLKPPCNFESWNEYLQEIGELGQKFVVEREKIKLYEAGLDEQAEKVSDAPAADHTNGFDVISYTLNKKELRIEVKATPGPCNQPFYILANERQIVENIWALGEYYEIHRVYNIQYGDVGYEIYKNFDEFDFEELVYKVKKNVKVQIMNNGEILLNAYVLQTEKNFTKFMNIEKLPPFRIVEKKISLSAAINKGFGSFASHHYYIPTGMHTLEVWSNIYQPQLNAEYLLFHEFTHIHDTEMYVQKDKTKNVMYKVFSEYHAGQIDFLKVLGVKKIDTSFNFSMKQRFRTVENIETAEEFVIAAYKTSSNLISRSNFPADVESLSVAFGLIFNYWGRRSICKIFAVDYVEKVDNETIEKCIGRQPFHALDAFMNGWLTVDQINLIGEFYLKMIVSKMKDYTL